MNSRTLTKAIEQVKSIQAQILEHAPIANNAKLIYQVLLDKHMDALAYLLAIYEIKQRYEDMVEHGEDCTCKPDGDECLMCRYHRVLDFEPTATVADNTLP